MKVIRGNKICINSYNITRNQIKKKNLNILDHKTEYMIVLIAGLIYTGSVSNPQSLARISIYNNLQLYK